MMNALFPIKQARWTLLAALVGLGSSGLVGCDRSEPSGVLTPQETTDAAGGTAGHGHADRGDAHDHDHDHEHGDEVELGKTMVGDLEIECWQGHGSIEPGKELHLVVKLPYNDGGATIVRAWIGTADRLASVVGRADYAASHDDYDVHAEAPDPLPADVKWWIEIEKPDGTTAVGSIAVL